MMQERGSFDDDRRKKHLAGEYKKWQSVGKEKVTREKVGKTITIGEREGE